MASVAEARRSPFAADPHNPNLHKSIPILPSSGSTLAPPRDPMDITPTTTTTTTSTMGPPTINCPPADRNGAGPFQAQSHAQSQREGNTDSGNTSPNGNNAPAVGAAAAAQQPKVVQTAFIHKLYNMLEDQSIQHLISWASTNESFVMSPSSEFSKVLSSVSRHFVAYPQSHADSPTPVSDVFHTGSPDTPLWEFKHGNGNFKRGDLVGLREIKRRASRHALIHRDSFSAPKLPTGPPAGQPVEPMPDPTESRLQNLEHSLYEMHSRMQRSEDTCSYLNQKSLVLAEGMMRCHQWNHDLANYIMAMVPDPENPIHRDVAMMQRDISRQTDMLRALEAPEEPLSARQPYFMQVDSSNGPPLSPRQMPQDNPPESRRGSLASISRQAPYKPPVPAHLAISPRRYGSIGMGNYSPSSARAPVSHQPPPPPPPPVQQSGAATLGSNLASNSSPPYNLYRRHTSADIRTHGWLPQQQQQQQQQQPNAPLHSPYASGHNSTQWPSSPHRPPVGGGDQQLRDALESYQLPRGPRQVPSRHGTPPGSNDNMPSTLSADSGWTLPGARYPFKGIDTPGPPTRRSSMASNVHSLLNPAETAERDDEDEPDDARKRKRMQ
ncbi:flocculation suppression protein [Stemphylium lycopersici]|uniref:Flocculation suppression protein n=1 Tax=Stemphylium lycopersici TaxID=183478 RepID=A0A364NG12_STELY|nr:flocculation suppression protein [Stemphylium lycopersici]RAR03804.1 flocculation suppression protein [Stemphylium lycopersici]RAR16202.1 flocculation suppression protein [Stemphylium lycopersici]